jgi:DNA-binding XRE family transcriptional regulator
MLAVVKKHRTDQALFEVRGDIPPKVVHYLKEQFGQDVEVLDENPEEMVDVFNTDWYKDISSNTSPGDVLKIYRENAELTQEELGRRLGKFTRQKISDMERGKRSISKEAAKKLSRIFQVPVDRFL